MSQASQQSTETAAPSLEGLSLRPATSGDQAFLFHLYTSTRLEEIQSWGWAIEHQQSFLRMQFDARRGAYQAEHPAAVESIVLAAGIPAGVIRVDRNPSEIRLVDIALLPEYRNRGLGSLVIVDLLRQAAEAQVPVRLSVARENRAKHLYERLEFTVLREDAMYFEMEYLAG
jgi:ribosomal protein S18 acetylase RimI-like enzyme